jgi:23S rRNA G2445 N2-methylase RlmL
VTGPRQRRAYRAALRIAVLKERIAAALDRGDEAVAAAAHAELVELEQTVRDLEAQP